MLGSDRRIRRFTPSAEKMFNLLPTDVAGQFKISGRIWTCPICSRSSRAPSIHSLRRSRR